jgi:hypothetical protein
LHVENQLFCQKCHAPVAVFTDLFADVALINDRCLSEPANQPYCEESRGHIPDSHALLRQIAGIDSRVNVDAAAIAADKTKEPNAKTAMEGVTCTVCHKINGQQPASDDDPFRPGFEQGIANSGYRIEHYTGKNFGLGGVADQMIYGPYEQDDLNPPLNDWHGLGEPEPEILGKDGIKRPYIQTGEFCGSCHDVRIPQEDVESGKDFREVENLFTEWRTSPWNNNDVFEFVEANPRELARNEFGNPIIGLDGEAVKLTTTCQDCHMSEFMLDPDAAPGVYAAGQIADGAFERDRVSNHRFMGVDRFLVLDLPTGSEGINGLEAYDISEVGLNEVGDGTFSDLDASHLNFNAEGNADVREVLLQKAVDFEITSARVRKGVLAVEVTVENVGAGHNIPAGLSQERQVWIELEVLDKKGNHVYTSGYLTPLEEPDELFDPMGSVRYRDSYCGADNATHEYECDLDSFRVKLDVALRIEDDSLVDGDDQQLVNYQNGFRFQGEKVFSQFIADAIDNSNSLAPFKPQLELYEIPVNQGDQPFTINARLRFRPLPHEFLNVLKQDDDDFATSRVTKEVIERNEVIEMEQDSCVTVGQGRTNADRCSNGNGNGPVKAQERSKAKSSRT